METAKPMDHPENTERESQTVTIEDVGPGRKRLTIEVPADRITKKIESSYSDLKNEATIPGFRRGRVPRHLLERRFGSSIRDEVRTRLLSECYTQAIEEEKLQVIGQPDVKDVDQIKLPESGPLQFKVEVEVSPTVALPELTGIEIKKTPFTVTPQDTDREIDQLRKRMGKLVQAPNTTIQSNDYLEADVTILPAQTTPDTTPGPIAEHPNMRLLVPGLEHEGKGQVAGILVEDLQSRLVGQPDDAEISISLTGPTNHENERIKGQPITIRIKVHKVERLELAPIENIPAQLGLGSVEDLKQRITQMLQNRKEREQQQLMHEQLSNHLIETVKLDLPEGVTGRQTARLLRSEAMRLAYRGVDEHEIEKQIAEMRQNSEEQARKQLKRFFILDQAAKDLQVEASEAEVNGQIAMIAVQQNRRPEKLRQQLQRSGELEHLFLQVREQKTLDKILEKAKIVEVDAPA
jgi:trigger factor